MASRLNTKMKSKSRSGKSIDEKSGQDEGFIDTSVLQKPLNTSVTGLAKAFQLFQTATKDVQDFLLNECDILYECRICRSIFRSLANYIMHKRTYCPEKFNQITHTKWPRNDDEDFCQLLQRDPIEIKENHHPDKNENTKKTLGGIIECLAQKKQFGVELKDFSIGEFYEKLNKRENVKKETNVIMTEKILELEKIEGSNSGMLQTVKERSSLSKTDETKMEILELHNILEGQSAVLGPDGKVIDFPILNSRSVDDDENKRCDICNITFATRKTLLSHLRYKHENSRLVYPCPECPDVFSTIWSVYRHLYNIHKKSNGQVRKIRQQILSNAFKRSEIPESRKKDLKRMERLNNSYSNDQEKIDDEDQAWMDNFESDNDIQMCGGCGRRFERRAALNSHSQTCQKRIAARNLIQLNRQKRSAAAADDKPEQTSKKSKLAKVETENNPPPERQRSRKRKIGIQIRYDYTKSEKQNDGDQSETAENDTELKKALRSSNQTSKMESKDVKDTALRKMDENHAIESRLMDEDIISIPSSDSTPVKDENDPLSSLVSERCSTDSDIEEIFVSPANTLESSDIPILRSESDDTMKDINESTMKLISLITSNNAALTITPSPVFEQQETKQIQDFKMMEFITNEETRPTLDDRMKGFINHKKLECKPCSERFTNISKLRLHMSGHFNWFRYRCDICTFKSFEKQLVMDHVKSVHSIQCPEKIEAVIFHIQEWETIEMASDQFQMIPPENIVVERKLNASGNTTPVDCILIDSDENLEVHAIDVKSRKMKKQQKLKITKVKKKIEDIIDNDMNGMSSDAKNLLLTDIKEELELNQSDAEDSLSRSSILSNEPAKSVEEKAALKKMVYEVIFGQSNTSILNKVSNSSEMEPIPANKSSFVSRGAENATNLDSKAFLVDSHDEDEEDDIYIVENDEIIAVK